MDSLEALKKAKIPGPETGIEKKNQSLSYGLRDLQSGE